MTEVAAGELVAGSALTKALLEASAELPTIKANTKGQDGNRSYQYATLADILEQIRPVLSKHGLVLSHRVEDGQLVTSLLHTSGEGLHSYIPVPMPTEPKPDAWKTFGAGMTYARRYAVAALLSIAVDEDRDAPEGRSASAKAASRAASASAKRKQGKGKQKPAQAQANGNGSKPLGFMLDVNTLEIHQVSQFSTQVERDAKLVAFLKREIMDDPTPNRATTLVKANHELIESLPDGCKVAVRKAYEAAKGASA